MLILIKTPTITFSLDVSADDSTDILFQKVGERTEYKRFQFDLLFAGDKLSKGTVGSCGIKKESTVHMVVIKELKYTVVYGDRELSVSVPNNDGLKVMHLEQQIRNTLKSEIPELVTHRLALHQLGNPLMTPSGAPLQDHFSNYDSVEIKLTEPPAKKAGTKVNKFSSSLSSKSKRSSYGSTPEVESESESSDDEPVTKGSTPGTAEDQFDKDALLNSFVESSISSDVEVVFCFDTTGSMSSIIANVRKQVEKTVTRLMKDIPSIRIGIMGLGDYCDGEKVLTTLDLTQNVDELVKFIKSVPNTSGGDAPEAYEYALFKAKELTWSQHTSKAFVMIGDSNPHQPSFTDLKINWFQECDDLYDRGIKVYGVKALGSSIFYNDIAERTGGICINFNKFDLITEMFLAICYREASNKKFQEYQNEIAAKGDEQSKEMAQILTDLNKENYTVEIVGDKTKGDEKETEKEKEKEETSTTTTSTSTTTTPEPESVTPKKVIQKQYGQPTTIKSKESWYDIKNDKGSPQYFYSATKGYFLNTREKGSRANSTVTPYIKPSAPATSSKGSSRCTATDLFNFTTLAHPYNPTPGTGVTAYVVGDTGVGKSTFVNSMNYVAGTLKTPILFRDALNMTFTHFNDATMFIVCFDVSNKESYDNLQLYIQEIRKRDVTKPIAVVALHDDTPNASKCIVDGDLDNFKAIYSCIGAYPYSQYMANPQLKALANSLRANLPGQRSKSCLIM